MMNDTLDNFTFTGLDVAQNNTKILDSGYTCNERNKRITESVDSNEISFDDSIFLNDTFLGLENLDINDGNIPCTQQQKCSESQGNVIHSTNETFLTNNIVVPENRLRDNSELHASKLDKNLVHDEIPTTDALINDEKLTHSVLQNISNTPLPLSLASWGVPDPILAKYANKNVTQMFPWQAECLSKERVISKFANLVYSAPTSAGKTLVAEILAIKTLMERKKKVIFILPFVSVVREKMFYFQDLLEGTKIRVEGYMGSYNPPGGFESIQVAICTIEKANNLINKLLTEDLLSIVGAVIVDELHLIGDASRGYLLELLLTKLKYMSDKYDNVNIQIIGMSATLPNLNVIASWLDAELYVTNYRPIPLYEQVHVCGEIYSNDLKLVRCLSRLPDLDIDTDNILQLCLETVSESASVLIFCPTKNWCENLAQQISSAFWKLGTSDKSLGHMLRKQLNSELITETLQQLKLCPVGLDDILCKTVSFGVGFHHAGLTMDERDIIEGSFRTGALRILVATSTLSSGVNLPARRVIIRTPLFHGKPIDSLAYRQMIGRAGRMGKDKIGESILICQKTDHKIAKLLLSAKLEEIQTCLEDSGKIKRAILEIIASGVAAVPEDLELFTSCTLLFYTHSNSCDENNPIHEAVEFLVDNEFIRLQNSENEASKYIATALGRACLTSSLPPHEGLALFAELEKARRCFVLDSELHLIYLVTPYSACNQWGNIDWMQFLDLWNKLPNSMKRVGEIVGIEESYLIKASRGQINIINAKKLYHKLLLHKRFYVALALQDLVNEISLKETASKFGCNRGMLQSLQQSASTFAGMVTSFSKQLRWSSVEILISQFQDRLHYGVSRDLLDLMKIPILNSVRARALFNAGIETLSDLANSDVHIIENILIKLVPFESSKERDGETAFDVKQRNNLRNVWITGKQGLSEGEAAKMLIEEARKFLVIELGIAEARWHNRTIKSNNSSFSALSVTTSESSASLPSRNTSEHMESCVEMNSIEIGTEVIHNSPQSCNLHDNSNESLFSPLPLSSENYTEIYLHSSSRTKQIHERQAISDDSLFDDSTISSNVSQTDISNCETTKDLNYADVACVMSESNISDNADMFNNSFDDSKTTSASSLKKRRHSEGVLGSDTPQKKNKLNNNEADVGVAVEQNCIQTDFTKFNIVDVCKQPLLFETFCRELKTKTNISLSTGCLKIDNACIIGERIIDRKRICVNEEKNKFSNDERLIDGIAVCWGENTVYYVNLQNINYSSSVIKLLEGTLCNTNITVGLFDSKEQIKLIQELCGININIRLEDPKIIDWIFEPDGKEKNLKYLVADYCPEALPLSEIAGCYKSHTSIALDTSSSNSPRIRSCVEALLVWYLLPHMKNSLIEENKRLLDVFYIEAECILCLARMELRGFPVNKLNMEETIRKLRCHLESLEKKAFSLVGRKFSMASSKDVARILGISNGKRVSTKKDVLKKLQHPVSELVLEWRKIHFTLYKMIIPILQEVRSEKIHMNCITHNSTGRISMHEPNLQNITKDFEMKDPLKGSVSFMSCRNLFVASKECILLSADYCQLELRILAHFTQDEILCNIMKSEGDIFKSIAARWNHISESQVTDVMRHQTKQICYGVIYGMGIKTLAEQMSVCEEDAGEFVETFHRSYPGIRTYIKQVIDNCREDGYVETLAGRRRYLPHIKDAQAERQAVNTTIQGSAADLTKKAMVMIESQLYKVYGHFDKKPGLVLHLHDELIYEVPLIYIQDVAHVVKNSMEKSVELSIPFPVKMKSGRSWGEMTEFKL